MCGQQERDFLSPVVFVMLSETGGSAETHRARLRRLAEWVRLKRAILLTVPIRSPLDSEAWGPAIRLVVTVRHEMSDLEAVVDALRDGLTEVSRDWR